MANEYKVSLLAAVCSVTLACAGAGKGVSPAPPITELSSRAATAAPAPPAFSVVLVPVKGGCYQMGSASEVGGPEEKPAHEVCVDDFHIGKYEVTQGQWKSIMGTNPSSNIGCGEACPVEMVSWNDALLFLEKLNILSSSEPGSLGPYRLPTEAEWEFAARSGGKVERYAGETDDLDRVAWHLWNTDTAQPVGSKAPNGLGIHDMSGSVWEWTSDWYDATYYASSPRANPTGPTSGEHRVLRGGGRINETFDLRTTYRNHLSPDHRGPNKGVRLVRAAPVQSR